MRPRLCQCWCEIMESGPKYPHDMLRGLGTMRVERFTVATRSSWDQFVRSSKNGTFLFLRDYMEYHQDRFEDHSLIVRAEGEPGPVIGLLPANRRGGVLESHGGLTYGGVVSGASMTA